MALAHALVVREHESLVDVGKRDALGLGALASQLGELVAVLQILLTQLLLTRLRG